MSLLVLPIFIIGKLKNSSFSEHLPALITLLESDSQTHCTTWDDHQHLLLNCPPLKEERECENLKKIRLGKIQWACNKIKRRLLGEPYSGKPPTRTSVPTDSVRLLEAIIEPCTRASLLLY